MSRVALLALLAPTVALAIVLPAEHTQRLATALSAQSVRSTYRRGSNRVPNGAAYKSDAQRLDLSQFCNVLE